MNAVDRQKILRRPLNLAETGLTLGTLSDLTIKLLYSAGEIGAGEIGHELRLPFAGIVQRVLELFDREELVNIVGTGGFGEQSYRYTISQKGIERARQALERSQYVGPAPVPLERYNDMMRGQAVSDVRLAETDLIAAFEGMVVNQAMLDKIGPALSSGQSIFLYGPSGNGKTTVATRMARLLAREPIYIPFAVSVGNYIIKVFDDFNHRRATLAPVAAPAAWAFDAATESADERWLQIERPMVMVGGELTMASLDLIWDPVAKYYEAPFQMKANGGMFLIDDFGRQQMDPQDLLNRWIVPLETRVDFLSLHTGKKIEIPFEQLVVFSTNLDPTKLVDEAFLRRIRHKVKVDNPSASEFQQVFQAVCRARGVEYMPAGFTHMVSKWYETPQRAFKNSHPRDIVDQLLDFAKYKRLRPVASPEMLDVACMAYFADL